MNGGCRPLTDPEVEAVLAHFDGPYAARDRAFFMLGTKSGFRTSELLSLRIGDLVQNGEVVERVLVQKRSMKGKMSGRSVILHMGAREELAKWLKVLEGFGYTDAGTYLFLSQKGTNRPIGRIQAWRILHGQFMKMGLEGKVACHSMRKTFAGKVYEALGKDLVKTQRALGHADINSTSKYLSFREDEIDKAILGI